MTESNLVNAMGMCVCVFYNHMCTFIMMYLHTYIGISDTVITDDDVIRK